MICARSKIFTQRLLQFAAILLIGLGASALPTTAVAQSSCGPQSQQSGTHCKGPTDTPWRYLSDIPQVGTHTTMGDLTSAMISYIMGQAGPPKCSVTLDSLVPQGGTGYAWPTVAWSDISHDFTGTFTTVWTNLSPCDTSQTSGIGIHQQRNFFCPAGYTALVQGGNAYCALDWWRADPKKPCGSCAEGDVNVGGGGGGSGGSVGGAGGQGSSGIGSGNNPRTAKRLSGRRWIVERATRLQQQSRHQLFVDCTGNSPIRAWLVGHVFPANRAPRARNHR